MRYLFSAFLIGCMLTASTTTQVSGSIWVFPPQHGIAGNWNTDAYPDLTGSNSFSYRLQHWDQSEIDYDTANWKDYLHAVEVPTMDEYNTLQKETESLKTKLDDAMEKVDNKVITSLNSITKDEIIGEQRDTLKREIMDEVSKKLDDLRKEIEAELRKQ